MKLMDCIEDKSKSTEESKCDVCIKQGINQDMFEGELEYFHKPFRGTNPYVMVIGQDPTISTREVNTVLDLDNGTISPLFRFLIKDIIEAVGLSKDDIYATNLIKCRFPNNQTPNKISKGKAKGFLTPFFKNCRKLFEDEILQIKPKIVISLGQPVHQLLCERYNWDVPLKLKDAFSKSYEVNIRCEKVEYTPCIHINTKRDPHYQNLWQSFIENLAKTVDQM